MEYSIYRFVGDNKHVPDEEWYRRATNSCQTEIARVMALPENERLNMTAILDAKIAAIEAAEARAARRAVWKRRFRLGAFIILPVLCIASAGLFVLKKKTTYGKSSWWRTVESLVVVIVTAIVVGVVSVFEHRRECRKTTDETAPPHTIGNEPASLEWHIERYDEYKREKDRADDAVIKYRVTNQFDSIIGRYESLKLAHNQLLADLARAELRMSNETDVAQLDLLGKQASALREKVAEIVRARADLRDRISKEEGKLIQLERARELANKNYMDFLLRMEQARRHTVGSNAGERAKEP